MDKQTQEYFNTLVAKSPSSLSPEEIGFLKARRSYLDPVQREIFGEVLGLDASEKPLSKAQKKTETVEVAEDLVVDGETLAEKGDVVEVEQADVIEEPKAEEPKAPAKPKAKK